MTERLSAGALRELFLFEKLDLLRALGGRGADMVRPGSPVHPLVAAARSLLTPATPCASPGSIAVVDVLIDLGDRMKPV